MSKVLLFSEFVEYIRENVQTGWWEDREMEVRKIRKNNGKEMTALLFFRKESKITPTFYLEDFYEEYLKTGSGEPSLMLTEIHRRYESAEYAAEEMDVECLTSYDAIRDRIVFRVVNYERNKEMLENSPHIRIYDLAVTFHTMIRFNESAVSSAVITNGQMEMWGITPADLVLDAERNTRRIFPAEITPLHRFLMDQAETDPYGDEMIYVASNNQMFYGAAVLLYEDLLEDFSRRMGCSFYLLPSSVHEVLLVPDHHEFKDQELRSMVREVNETVVSQEEILSDSLYYYEKERHRLVCKDLENAS